MLSLQEINEILDYVENFDEKGIQFVVLGTVGRSGCVLLHSLLDSHPQVLQIPTHVCYYADWELTLQYATPDTLVEDFFSKSPLLHRKIPQLGSDRTVTLDLKFEQIQALMNELVPYLSALNRKNFLLLFHFVYAKVFQIDLKPIKVLLLHHHWIPTVFGYLYHLVQSKLYLTDEEVTTYFDWTPQQYLTVNDAFFENLLADFPNLKLLATLRDPMAMIYSTGMYSSEGITRAAELSYYYWASYHLPLMYASLYPLKKKLGDRLQFIKFEDIHCHTETIMRETASFLGIHFEESLLSSTFGGLLWSGSIATDKIIFGTHPRIIQEDRKWEQHWDPHTKALYALICTPLARTFGYEPYHISSEGLDIEALIPEEQKVYQGYPIFLAQHYHRNIAELQQRQENHHISFDDYCHHITLHFHLLQNRMQFREAYLNMRKQAIACFQKTAIELNQLEPLIINESRYHANF